jgi:hypothetical protein
MWTNPTPWVYKSNLYVHANGLFDYQAHPAAYNQIND